MSKQLLIALTFLGLCSCASQSQRWVLSTPPPEAPPVPPAAATPLHPDLRALARQVLLAEVGADNGTLRSNAIEALGDADPADAIGPTLDGLSDPDPDVRFAACMVVGQLHITRAYERLLHMHDSDESAVVQIAVRYALHKLGDTRFSHDLEKFAASPSPEIRGKTAMVLGLLGEPSAVVLLEPMLRDPSEPIRLQAAESLWRLGNEDGLKALAAYAISGYPDDAILATLAMAAPRNQQLTGQIRGNLTSDFPEVRLATARALGMLGSDEGYTIAVRYTTSLDPRQRFLAALALGAIGRSDAQPKLAPMLHDANPAVRIGAATAILELRPPASSAAAGD